jgi:hypothetical protein
MGKYVLCCLGMLALSLPARAGELDNEQLPTSSGKAAMKAAPSGLVKATAGSELDKEAPQQSWRCCRRCCGCWGGCGRCWGCCRCCYPVVACYPTFSCCQPYCGAYAAGYGGGYGAGYGGYYGY